MQLGSWSPDLHNICRLYVGEQAQINTAKAAESCLWLIKFLMELFNISLEMRDILRDGGPQHILADMYVIVHKHITHGYYRAPVYLRVRGAELVRQHICRLADNLDLLHQAIIQQPVIEQFIFRICC